MVRAQPPTSLGHLVTEVAASIRGGGFSSESAARLLALMRRFESFAVAGWGCPGAGQVTAELVDGFVRARSRDGSAPAVATMHLRRSTVRLLFAEGRRLGLVDHDPTLDLRLPPRTSLRTRPLTDDEVLLCRSYALRTSTETRQPAAWALAEATARSTELARIRVRDVDLVLSRVWIAGSTKTEPRWGTLSDWGRLQVNRRIRAVGPAPDALLVCATAKQGVSSTSSASTAIAETLRRAGLHRETDVRPGSVAAWAGAKAFAAGMPIDGVARMLGIRSLDRTAAFIGFEWRMPDR